MTVTVDNICDIMSKDYYDKRGHKFQGESGWRDAITSRCGFGDEQFAPMKLRAMWAYYISDPDEMKYGASIKRFTEHRCLMKFASRVFVQRDGKPGSSTLYPLASYRCANFYNGCGANDVTFARPKGTATPDVLEEPCYKCGGRMMREDLWFEAFVGGKLTIRVLTPAPAPIASSAGLRGPTQDIVEQAEVTTAEEWGVEDFF